MCQDKPMPVKVIAGISYMYEECLAYTVGQPLMYKCAACVTE